MGAFALATYGTPEYETSVARLRATARAHGACPTFGFCELDFARLRHECPVHFSRSPHGAWVWKPHVVAAALARLSDGDALLYCDSTCEIVDGDAVRAVFTTMREGGHQIAAPQLRDTDHGDEPYPNNQWTAPFCLRAMQEPADADYPQLSASTLFFIVGEQSRAFVDRWTEFTNDPDCCCPEDDGTPQWKNHRHDQSVLSVLARRHPRALIVPDVTQYGPPDAPKAVQLHRCPPPVPRVVAITSTSGDYRDAVATVREQSYPYISHVVALDGGAAVPPPLRDPTDEHVTHYISLPYRTGSRGHICHLVYSTFPTLVCADDSTYVAFIDDDCRWDRDHIATMVAAVTRPITHGWRSSRAEAAFCFRRILDRDGRVVCRDECESLGTCLPNIFGEHFVDTNCWLLSAKLAQASFRVWHVTARPAGGRTQEADRRLSTFIWRSGALSLPTGRWTVDYTAKGGRSVAPDFFLNNNPPRAPSERPSLYVFHLTREATRVALDADRTTDPLGEWHPTQLLGLRDAYTLIDGFAHCDKAPLPLGARVLVVMFHPAHIPYDMLVARPDLTRICYTAESPNARHAAQWRYDFLRPAFDAVLTYWRPLLRKHPEWAFECPHNTHWWDADALPAPPTAPRAPRACCVLEARPGEQQYSIDGETLHCLDGLRQRLIDEDPSLQIDLYGRGWRASPGATLVREAGKFEDREHARDIYTRYAFTLVVENCDAEGYVSEKAYDALSAGSLPLYYGGSCPDWAIDVRNSSPLSSCITSPQLRARARDTSARAHEVLRTVSFQAFAQRVQHAFDHL